MNVRWVNGSKSPDGTLRELAALGQLRGALTIEDIREALPIDRMTHDEVARAVAYLEEKGIEVLIDPSLMVGPASTREELVDRTVSAGPPKTTSSTPELSQQLVRSVVPGESPRGDLDRSVSATVCVLLAAFVVCILGAVLFWKIW